MADDINSDVRDLGKYTVGQWIAFAKVQAATAYERASAYVTRGVVAGAVLGYTGALGVSGAGYHEPVRDWAVRHNFAAPQPVVAKVEPPRPVTYKDVDLMPVLSAVATLAQSVETKFAQTNAAVVDSRNTLKGELVQLIADVPQRTGVAVQAVLAQQAAERRRQEQKRPAPPPIAPAVPPAQPAPPKPAEPSLLEQIVGK